MKKLLFMMAVAAVGLTSCADKDDTYERLKPVAPGLEIAGKSRLQNYYSMQPLDAAFRLALLLAEADGEEDLSQMTYENMRLIDLLFDGQTVVTRVDDDYLITFRPGIVDAYGVTRNGSLLVKTGGRLQLSDTDAENPWTVTPQEFEMRVVVNGSTGILHLTGGEYRIHAAGDGSYTLSAGSVTANFEGAELASLWNGGFTVRPADASLKYSACAGEIYEVSGSGRGTSNFSFDGKTLMGLEYKLTDGRHKVITTIESGTEVAQLDSNGSYDHATFPSPEVEIVWSRDEGGALHRRVTYNDVTVSM